MQLKVKQNIGKDKVVLTYKTSPTKPVKTPSYIIKKEKADEFVKKYNSQEKILSRLSIFLTLATSTIAGIFSIKQGRNNLYKSKFALFKPLIHILIGTLTGGVISSMFSSKLKNNLKIGRAHV